MMTKIMKHLFAASLVCCCITATLTGCQMKEDDLFEMDAANRSDAWMADYRRVFNNNDYGWALYTMNPTSRHPSVATYAVKFDQVNSTFYKSTSTVRLPGVADKDSLVSMYSFKMDNGIVLSFDTYNGFFHWYADQSQYFSQDMQGDFEFCLDRYSENEDTIFGRGKTKQLPFVMIKLPSRHRPIRLHATPSCRSTRPTTVRSCARATRCPHASSAPIRTSPSGWRATTRASTATSTAMETS